MRLWFRNIRLAIRTIAEGMYVTLDNMVQTFRRKAFTQHFEYPEVPVPIKPRYRGFHRFDLTTCIGCDKCACACPVDCIYIEKEKAKPPLKGFAVTGFKIDYTKCMFLRPVRRSVPGGLYFHGLEFRFELFQPRRLHCRLREAALGNRLWPGDA